MLQTNMIHRKKDLGMIFIEELALNTHTRLNLFVKNGVFTYMKGAKVIDIGCGTGFFSNIISQYTKSLICLDISEGNLEYAKKNKTK